MTGLVGSVAVLAILVIALGLTLGVIAHKTVVAVVARVLVAAVLACVVIAFLGRHPEAAAAVIGIAAVIVLAWVVVALRPLHRSNPRRPHVRLHERQRVTEMGHARGTSRGDRSEVGDP